MTWEAAWATCIPDGGYDAPLKANNPNKCGRNCSPTLISVHKIHNNCVTFCVAMKLVGWIFVACDVGSLGDCCCCCWE